MHNSSRQYSSCGRTGLPLSLLTAAIMNLLTYSLTYPITSMNMVRLTVTNIPNGSALST